MVLSVCAMVVLIVTDSDRRLSILQEEQPIESERIRHPAGFSIIKPSKWIYEVQDIADWGNSITIRSDKGRLPNLYSVSRIRSAVPLHKLGEEQFQSSLGINCPGVAPVMIDLQGKPAAHWQEHKIGTSFEDPS
jgi:hypothetical protein